MTNYDQIINELRKLRFLKPNRAFAETSKTSILASAKPNHFYGFLSLPRLAPALSFAAVVLVVVASYVIFVPPKPTVSAAFNPENLSQEFAGLTINVQLQEVEYQQNANQAIASALGEITNTSVKHLNQTLLESEEESIDVQKSTNPEIDDLLNSVIF